MSTIGAGLRSGLKRVLPVAAADALRRRRLAHQAARLGRACRPGLDIDLVLTAAFTNGRFVPNQLRPELAGLLRRVNQLAPRLLLEIGAEGGGNLFALSHAAAPDAAILSIDLNFTPLQMAAYPGLVWPGQRLTCVRGDSHDARTFDRVRDWLGGRLLDFLFIDGDHSYEGVAADFRLYAPLVRRNGTIALHDIVPDYTTRFGRKTSAYAGGVPVFWTELKQRYPGAVEIVADPQQDGCGIGVIEWTGDTP